MSFEKGTLVYVNYTAKVKDTGEAIESTNAEDAKRMNIYDAGRRYEPRLVAVGEEWVLRGLDNEISQMDTGQRKTVELTPDRAWGERDPTLLRMIPLRKFGDKADELRVGDVVDVDNRIGVVRFLGSGRAQVDFNHRLAGKTLVYDVEVVKKVDGDEDKIRALIKRRFSAELGDKVEFSRNDGAVTIEIPESAFLAEGLQVIKRGIANDIGHFLPSVSKVSFTEVFLNRPPPPAAEEQKATTAEEQQASEAPVPSSSAEVPQTIASSSADAPTGPEGAGQQSPAL